MKLKQLVKQIILQEMNNISKTTDSFTDVNGRKDTVSTGKTFLEKQSDRSYVELTVTGSDHRFINVKDHRNRTKDIYRSRIEQGFQTGDFLWR